MKTIVVKVMMLICTYMMVVQSCYHAGFLQKCDDLQAAKLYLPVKPSVNGTH